MKYYEKSISKMQEIQDDLNKTSKFLQFAMFAYCFLCGFALAVLLNMVTA